MDYKIMYALLLGEIDKALTLMESQKYDQAYGILLDGCAVCEEQYIDRSDQDSITRELLLRLLDYCREHEDIQACQTLSTQFGYILRDE